ncbi:hypothetical protein BU15DRAFT_76225 [Melanogaster broomeanus]|nr:hypothetical protein BU15DRAFT_76225 [Melanogaster broomeanus]
MASNSTSHTAEHRALVVGDELTLARDIAGESDLFKKGQKVTVEAIRQAPSSVGVQASSDRAFINPYQPGQPQEPNAYNTMYKLGVLGMVPVITEEPLQQRCEHSILSRTQNGRPDREFYEEGEEVFLIEDFQCRYQGATRVVKRKSVVRLKTKAMSRTGSTRPRDTKHCYYMIALQTQEYVTKVVAKTSGYYQRGIFDSLPEC